MIRDIEIVKEIAKFRSLRAIAGGAADTRTGRERHTRCRSSPVRVRCFARSGLSLFICLLRVGRPLKCLEDGLLIGGDCRWEGVFRAVDRDGR